MRRRVTSPTHVFTFLQQRLLFMANEGGEGWINLTENVPLNPRVGSCEAGESSISQYAPSQGEPLLREAVARRSPQADVRPDNVVVTNGALHGIHLVARHVLRTGRRHVLCQAPIYCGIVTMLRSLGFRCDFFEVPSDRALDRHSLERQMNGDTALLILNSPHNPSGRTLRDSELRMLTGLAAERSCALLVDMVYDSFAYDNAALSPCQVTADWRDIFTVHSMSKTFGAPGLRVGWVITSTDNAAALAGLLESDCVAVSGIVQKHAAKLLQQGNEHVVQHCKRGRDKIAAALARVDGVSFDVPEAGVQLYARLPVADVESLADAAMTEERLVLTTASNYAGASGPFVRIPFGGDLEATQSGIERLSSLLGRWHD